MNKLNTSKRWRLGQLAIGFLLIAVLMGAIAPAITPHVTPAHASVIVLVAVVYVLAIAWKESSHPFTYVISAVMIMLAIFNMIYANDDKPLSQRASGALSALMPVIALLVFSLRIARQEQRQKSEAH